MKLTLKNVKGLKPTASTLQKRVLNYVIDEWSAYDDKTNIFTDVLRYGCQSGVVGFLIWYTDTVRFYHRYKTEVKIISLRQRFPTPKPHTLSKQESVIRLPIMLFRLRKNLKRLLDK